jgi:hypothetical protein
VGKRVLQDSLQDQRGVSIKTLSQVFSLYKPQDSAGVVARMPVDPADQLANVGKLATENGGEYCTTLVHRLFVWRFYPAPGTLANALMESLNRDQFFWIRQFNRRKMLNAVAANGTAINIGGIKFTDVEVTTTTPSSIGV